VTHVVITGGGTGGHLFPGLAVAAELRRSGASVSWLGAIRGIEATRVPAAGIPLRALPVTGMVGRSPIAAIGALCRVVPATAIAASYLLRHDAAAVLSVGGYASVPGALAALLLGVSLVIQEQNALPGTANRLLAPWAAAIACGFPSSLSAFPSLPAVWTGNPVRAEFFTVPPPPLEPPAVLVLGGSQGSAFLNRRLPEAFRVLARSRALPTIVHQSGHRWEAEVRDCYATLGINATVVPFLERPADALASSALVIARAGALTVSEIAAARRAALLIPFAAAAHGHQLVNARLLAESGAATILEESEARPETVAATLDGLLGTPDRLVERGRASGVLARDDAARALARLVLECAEVSTALDHGQSGGATREVGA
jgi:UDP-N-acetylglucosamine--N-acetylmuramyl-(pentapeptide) pyrophosphoryl-undecaprenol N-acetylglucosamine transferase